MSFINVAFLLIKETLLSMIAKVAFKTVAERFMTRLVIYALNKLKDYSTNDVIDETVEDIINQLDGKKLKVIDELVIAQSEEKTMADLLKGEV
jgi:hypothetical protein